MKTKMKLGKPVRYKINNVIVNSVYNSVLDSVNEEVYMAPKNSVWGFVNVSVWRPINNLTRWVIAL
jgi:thiamine biosynthesis protein ThiC